MLHLILMFVGAELQFLFYKKKKKKKIIEDTHAELSLTNEAAECQLDNVAFDRLA